MIKLIRCYIENFGKFSKFNYDFNQALNIINHENGWGKSTLATFIKVMFYGLATNRSKKDLDKNEREKYAPWQGGNFGGNLEFAINGQQYRIERFFGKTAAEDTFILHNSLTGKTTRDFSENIGEELFGLDAEGFQRTLFIPQKVLDSNINESIAKRLTNLIQGATEDFNYENAQKILDEERRLLSNRNGTGEIEKVQSAIQDKINQINDLNSSAAAIKEIQSQVDAVDLEIQKLTNAQTAVKKQIKDCVQTPTPKASGGNKSIWLLAVLWLLFGVVCLTLNKIGLWIVFGVCGVALLVAVGIYYFRHKHKLPSSPALDITELQTRETDLQNKIDKQREIKAAQIVRITQIQNDLTIINDLENEKENLKNRLQELKQKFAAVQNAINFLTEANDSLNTQFLQPMKQGLKKYLGLITGQNFDNLQLDTEFNLAFDEYGRSRNVEYYSKGYQNTFELCLRLALIEAIWGAEKPFVILDDPFVNLDEAKIANAKRFLHELASECQIIYFSCHTSRC